MSTQGNKLTAIADAIRAKEGSTGAIVANDFPARIAAIQTGVDTSDATAAASDILASKTAYVNGQKITGIIPTKSNSDLLITERLVGNTTQAQVSVPTGFYPVEIPRNIPKGVITAPNITVSSNGLITATETATAGYIVSDENVASGTKQLTTQATKTWTPTISNQTIASGTYLTGAQTIKGDSNLVASNIKEGVSIFGITGNYSFSLSQTYILQTNIDSNGNVIFKIDDMGGSLKHNFLFIILTPIGFDQFTIPDNTIPYFVIKNNSNNYIAETQGINSVGSFFYRSYSCNLERYQLKIIMSNETVLKVYTGDKAKYLLRGIS